MTETPTNALSPKKVLFTVRREYYDAIVAGTKTSEVRRADKRWRTVAERVNANPEKGVAVFLCGRSLHRRRIVQVDMLPTAEQALGRPPSEQGRRDVGDGWVLAFRLGEVVG